MALLSIQVLLKNHSVCKNVFHVHKEASGKTVLREFRSRFVVRINLGYGPQHPMVRESECSADLVNQLL